MNQLKKIILISIFHCLNIVILLAQEVPTVGLTYQIEDVEEGYTLFAPELNESVYLINNCGGVIKEWVFQDQPNRTAYLLPNGNVIKAGKNFLEIRNWENEKVWSYDVQINDFQLHHDIQPMPNGNILCILYDYYSLIDIVNAGRIEKNSDAEFKLDKIVELKPQGTNSAVIVWEWKLFDHLIQDIDPTKTNYGIVADHPELIDINYNPEELFNFSHMNGIDYNQELDQIIFSARNLNEIYIIDHSTTTEEAASHSGGNSGKGGDFLWRWGNPQVYDRGDDSDQLLSGQHDPKWVANGNLDAGKITIFNNRPADVGTPDSSELVMLNPEIVNGEYLLSGNTYGPSQPYWSWTGEIQNIQLRQARKSGLQSLPNGHILVCESDLGRISEIDKNGKAYWSYSNPHGNKIYNQFDTLKSDNNIFRAIKYPLDYPAFTGRILDSQGYIENENSLSEDCGEKSRIIIPTVLNANHLKYTHRFINPVKEGFITILGETKDIMQIDILTLGGKTVFTSNQISNQVKIQSLPKGLYLIQIRSIMGLEISRLIFQ